MRKMLALFGVTVLLAIATVSANTPRLADTLYPSSATFSDRLGDAVKSDGRGAYLNGLNKLEVGFHTVTNDFVLRGGGPPNPRALALSFTPIGGGPSGNTQEASIFMNIRRILDLPSGGTRTALAIIDSSVGAFRGLTRPPTPPRCW